MNTPKVTCGVSGVVEHEENEEELCFLKVKQDCEQNLITEFSFSFSVDLESILKSTSVKYTSPFNTINIDNSVDDRDRNLLRAELLLVRDGRATDAWEDVLRDTLHHYVHRIILVIIISIMILLIVTIIDHLLTLAPSGGCWLLRKLTN